MAWSKTAVASTNFSPTAIVSTNWEDEDAAGNPLLLETDAKLLLETNADLLLQ